MVQMVNLVSMVETQDFTDILRVAVLNHKQTLVSMAEILVSMAEILVSRVETPDFTDILKVADQIPNKALVMAFTTEILAVVSMEEMMSEMDQEDVQMVRVVVVQMVTAGTVASTMMSLAVDSMAVRVKGVVDGGKMGQNEKIKMTIN